MMKDCLAWLYSNGNTVPIKPHLLLAAKLPLCGCVVLSIRPTEKCLVLLTGHWNVKPSRQETGRMSFYVCGCFDGWCEQKCGAMMMQCFCFTKTDPIMHLCELRKHSCKMSLCFYFFQALQIITPTDLKSKVTERLHISSHSSSCSAIATAAFKLRHVTTR